MRKKFCLCALTALCIASAPVYAANDLSVAASGQAVQAVQAAQTEKVVEAKIPVSCTAQGSKEIFEVVMTRSDRKPSESELQIKDGSTKNFALLFRTPGTYHYEVFQRAGKENNTTYDSTVYDAAVYITENDNGELNAETIVFQKGGNQKSDKCSFVNKVQNAEGGNNGSNNSSSGGSGGVSGGPENSASSATSKESTEGTSRVGTGVQTFELIYAGIGLAGVLTALFAATRRRKDK